MAPKRSSPPASPRKAKKSRNAVNRDKCEAVMQAIESSAEELPNHVRTMLSKAAPSSMTVFASERDDCQKEVVSMIGQVLGDIEARLQSAVEEKQAAVDASESELTALKEEVVKVENLHLGAQQVTTEARHAVSRDSVALKTAKDELSASQSAEKTGNAALVKFEATKAHLDELNANVLQPIREKVAEKDALNKLTKVGKQYNFESPLLVALSGAFTKAPADRGSFDLSVFQQYEAALQEQISICAKELEEGEPARTSRVNETLGCRAVVESAQDRLSTSRTALSEANAAEKAADSAAADARHAAENFDDTSRSRVRALDEAKKAFTFFCEYSLACYNELKELAPPPEPVPEAEEPATVEEVATA